MSVTTPWSEIPNHTFHAVESAFQMILDQYFALKILRYYVHQEF